MATVDKIEYGQKSCTATRVASEDCLCMFGVGGGDQDVTEI
jgi:hypothetical protein